jgi:hypothetical protein
MDRNHFVRVQKAVLKNSGWMQNSAGLFFLFQRFFVEFRQNPPNFVTLRAGHFARPTRGFHRLVRTLHAALQIYTKMTVFLREVLNKILVGERPRYNLEKIEARKEMN